MNHDHPTISAIWQLIDIDTIVDIEFHADVVSNPSFWEVAAVVSIEKAAL